MALKDWKKVKKKHLAFMSFETKPNIGRTFDVINIYPPENTENNKWIVRYPSKTIYALSFTIEFDTKRQAIIFAKDYMRAN